MVHPKGEGKEHEKDDEGNGKDEDGNGRGREEEKDEERGGGIIAHFISNLVSPLSSPRAGEVKKRNFDLFGVENGGRGEDGGVSVRSEEDGGGGGGGKINNLISNFFHQSDQGEGGKQDGDGKEKVNVVIEDSKEVKTDPEMSGGGGGGGGIINNLVSHLPTSLPDDAAPSTDEATILIHSMVRD